MNDQEFNDMRTNIERVFADLYLIDVSTLNADQRKLHQRSLSAAYLALVNAEHSTLGQLTEDAKTQLIPLALNVQRLQHEVSGLPTPYEKLEAVAKELSAFGRLAQLL